jgi:DNA-binding NarL/FixJ family response regulator
MVAGDYPVARTGLRAWLERESDIEVVAEACSPHAAVTEAMRSHPHVAVMPLLRSDGLEAEAIRRVIRRCPGTRVIALVQAADSDVVLASARSGASACLTIEVAAEALVDAVREVAAGHSLIDPAVAAPVLEHLRNGSRQGPQDRLARLSTAELQVLDMLAHGRTNRQIAAGLGLSVGTAKRRVSMILGKLGVRSRAEATALAGQGPAAAD